MKNKAGSRVFVFRGHDGNVEAVESVAVSDSEPVPEDYAGMDGVINWHLYHYRKSMWERAQRDLAVLAASERGARGGGRSRQSVKDKNREIIIEEYEAMRRHTSVRGDAALISERTDIPASTVRDHLREHLKKV